MRRPSPLPPPPSRSDAAADEPIEVTIGPPPAGGRTRAEASEVHDLVGDTAPVLPLLQDDDGDDAEPGSPAEDDLTAGRTVRPRDVWAAARSRRRALRAEVRRFTARQRRRRLTWLAVAASVVLLVLGTVGAAYSPLFGVERVRVVGTSGLSAETVEQALSGQVGRPLPLVDSSEVKAALIAFPLVESYTLEARPPHELVVRIVERTPIGTVKSSAGYTLVDAAGVALSTTPKRPAGHPVLSVRGGITSKAFAAIGTVYRSLPDDIREQVTAISATTPNNVTLTLGKTDTDVVWGDATRSSYKAYVLEKMMISQPPSKVSVYDVSSPTAVVVR